MNLLFLYKYLRFLLDGRIVVWYYIYAPNRAYFKNGTDSGKDKSNGNKWIKFENKYISEIKNKRFQK